jgi:hypothetical protein
VILLANTPVALHPAGPRDAHGWTGRAVGPPLWSGPGSVQAAPTVAARDAAAGGGHGPGAPAARPTARLYVPEAAPLAPGQYAHAAGRWWAVGAVWPVPDPTGGPLGVWCADLAAAPDQPDTEGGAAWPTSG